MTEIEKLFTTLVKIDSPSGSESEMSRYLQTWLKDTGFDIKVDKVGNIFAYTKNKPKFFICAHMDTVEPGRGIIPLITKGNITSDGTTILGADNKAAICSIVTAINNYKNKYDKLPNVEIIFSVKEETGGGIEFFPFKWIKSKHGLIFDFAKPLGQITLASPYIYNFYAKFLGRSAHSSRPQEGINSMLPAIKFANKIKVGKMDKGETTINVGKINSGSGINTIPEATLIEGEVRSTNYKKFIFHLNKIEGLAKKSVAGTAVKLEFWKDGYCPGYKWDKDSSFISSVAKILKQIITKVDYSVSTGVSDANSFNGSGFQVVNLSDGVCNPHTKNESIRSVDLFNLAKIVGRFLEMW